MLARSPIRDGLIRTVLLDEQGEVYVSADLVGVDGDVATEAVADGHAVPMRIWGDDQGGHRQSFVPAQWALGRRPSLRVFVEACREAAAGWADRRGPVQIGEWIFSRADGEPRDRTYTCLSGVRRPAVAVRLPQSAEIREG